MDQLCDVCGGSSFELIDGLYYCVICQSQSQHYREVVADRPFEENILPNFATQLDFHATPNVSAQITAGLNEDQQPLSPTALYEVYTIILKQQAKVLVSYGFQPKVEDAVVKIWTKYLQKIGLWTKKHRKGEMRDSENTEEPTTNETIAGIMENAQTMNAESSVKNKEPKFPSRRSLTFYILYTALVDCGVAFPFADFLQLMLYDARFFRDICSTLPAAYSHRTIKAHLNRIISYDLTFHYMRCVAFARFVDFKKILPIDFSELMRRNLYSLNLPVCLLPILILIYGNIKNQFPLYCLDPVRTVKGKMGMPFGKLWPADLKCAAILIITLKLIFGIDDDREYVLSEIALKHRRRTITMFNFIRWLAQLKMRTAVVQGDSCINMLKKSSTYVPDSSTQQLIDTICYAELSEKTLVYENMEKFCDIFKSTAVNKPNRSRIKSNFRLRDALCLISDDAKNFTDVSKPTLRLFEFDFWRTSLDYLNSLTLKDRSKLGDPCHKTTSNIKSERKRKSTSIDVEAFLVCRHDYYFYDTNLSPCCSSVQLVGLYTRKFSKNFQSLLNLLSIHFNVKPAILFEAVRFFEKILLEADETAPPASVQSEIVQQQLPTVSTFEDQSSSRTRL